MVKAAEDDVDDEIDSSDGSETSGEDDVTGVGTAKESSGDSLGNVVKEVTISGDASSLNISDFIETAEVASNTGAATFSFATPTTSALSAAIGTGDRFPGRALETTDVRNVLIVCSRKRIDSDGDCVASSKSCIQEVAASRKAPSVKSRKMMALNSRVYATSLGIAIITTVADLARKQDRQDSVWL